MRYFANSARTIDYCKLHNPRPSSACSLFLIVNHLKFQNIQILDRLCIRKTQVKHSLATLKSSVRYYITSTRRLSNQPLLDYIRPEHRYIGKQILMLAEQSCKLNNQQYILVCLS
jgi:hypothetical protein